MSAASDKENEDKKRGEELYYQSSVANIHDFDEYSLTNSDSTTSSSLVALSQPQPTAEDDDDNVIPTTKKVESLKETENRNEYIIDLIKHLTDKQQEINFIQFEALSLKSSKQTSNEVNLQLTEAKLSIQKLIQENNQLLDQDTDLTFKLKNRYKEVQNWLSRCQILDLR